VKRGGGKALSDRPTHAAHVIPSAPLNKTRARRPLRVRRQCEAAAVLLHFSYLVIFASESAGSLQQ
jgi:hypothetical protein